MLYIVLGILAVIAVLLTVAVVRTLMIKAPATGECKTEITEEETEIAAKKTRRHGKSSNRFQKRGRGPFGFL